MKKPIFLLMAFLVLQATAQTTLTTKQWQDDLTFLQQTIHKDYSFLFKKVTPAEFDAAIKSLHKKIPHLEAHEISVGFARIISMFKYGHTHIGWRNNPVKIKQLPLNLVYFSDGIYVQGVRQDYADVLGAKVLKVGNMNIEDALKAIYPVVPVENEQFFKAYGLFYLASPEVLHAQGVISELSDTVEFTFKKGDKTFKRSLKALPAGQRVPRTYGFVQQKGEWLDAREPGETPLYLKHLKRKYYFEYLPAQKAVYVRQSEIQDDPQEDIPAFYKRLFTFIDSNKVSKLILDVRLNGGGNNYKNKPVITGIIEHKEINQKGKFFVILGRRTFSACQNLVNELDNYTNAIFIGEPTGENINFYGDNNEVILPNTKTPVYLSFAWWQDKPQWENDDWLAPHLAIDMSFEDYKTNKDPVVAAAFAFDGTDFILDPMKFMTDLYQSGQNEKLATEVPKMIQDPRYAFFNFEKELNTTGYNLLGRGLHEQAIAVFEFNTQLFPDSANVWDSLAEGYLKAGDTEKAIVMYTKALGMDPKGPTGKNAQKMLHHIKESKH